MHSFKHLYVLLIFVIILSISLSDDTLNEEPNQENQCAQYCLKVFLWNSVTMQQKLEACDKKNSQIAALQSQLAVLKLKEKTYERTIIDKDEQCKSEAQLYDEVYSIRKKVENLVNQAGRESKHLVELLKQLEAYRRAIEMKDERIKSLESTLQINSLMLETCKTNLSSSPAALMIMDSKREIQAKVYESSCINIGNSSDIWEIKVPGIEPFPVPCDGRIAGPGWTVIQRRVDNAVDFNRNWQEYRDGFGDLDGNLFIGLEKIYRMTNSRPHELYIHLENFNNTIRFARYNNFSIGSEEDAFQLKVLGRFSGDAGDSLKFERGMKFTTFDRDNDNRSFDNCAIERNGGWWYNQCSRANLNGRYLKYEEDKWDGIWWWSWQKSITLKSVQMLIRPITKK
ncbi:PREDICTED: microfibril-associated glycoprotein 4-like [Drosophila arizonae]|uniref:Microfibril-associated glycoprotein 4-like n=1 Tax=Drosophila arizonae TaxID=7263 RepID=A0ABM1PC42_DROAR|nr:PREDICTED: microfibril-associated glycoprotein 4-like [Drosophila arizonae]